MSQLNFPMVHQAMKNWIARIIQKSTISKTRLIKEPNWVTVYQSLDEYSVRIRKLHLEDNGIEAMIFDQRDSSYNAFGYIYLNVIKENEARAIQILEDYE